MEIERRAFLRCAAASSIALFGPVVPRVLAADAGCRYLSACRLTDGAFAVAEFDPEGLVIRTLPLADRGHSFAISADRSLAVAFARSPGASAIAFPTSAGGELLAFAAPAGRHFYGHGVFADGDRLLLATENDFETGRGVIGIYDATAGFARIGEFETYGIGPHEVILLPGGRTLAVAVGGIDTHPDAGETKLNLSTMDPSLAFIDVRTGELVVQHRLAPSLRQLSIRHLAVDARGAVWFGCQYEGAATDQPPLVGRAGPDFAPIMVDEGSIVRVGMQNYVGSVAASPDGMFIAASSPRGGQIVIVDVEGKLVGVAPLIDGCGIGGRTDGFVATSGQGVIAALAPDGSRTLLATPDLSFDNHVVAMDGI